MKTITQTDCEYITPNKTIETILISDGERDKTIFIYNYKGMSYRVFLTKDQLESFWIGNSAEEFHFGTERELDKWISGTFIC